MCGLYHGDNHSDFFYGVGGGKVWNVRHGVRDFQLVRLCNDVLTTKRSCFLWPSIGIWPQKPVWVVMPAGSLKRQDHVNMS